MPTIIDYAIVLNRLEAQGLKCHYYNSGAFGFSSAVATDSRGWIGPADDSIREAVRPLVRRVDAPYAQRLVSLLMIVRESVLAGPVWAMPKSHWAFEMEHGSSAWIPGLLKDIGLDPREFSGLTTAAAIEFVDTEDDVLAMFVHRLLDGLVGSDFLLAFPDRQTICTIHSHLQLWWTTADPVVRAGLDAVLSDLTKGE